MIVAHYCNLSIYRSDKAEVAASYRTTGLAFSLVGSAVRAWWRYQVWTWSLGTAELYTDTAARIEKWRLWTRGLVRHGWQGAWKEQAGLQL